jgi:CRP-like cAMP-binding protein
VQTRDTDLLSGLAATDASAIEALGRPVVLSAGDVLFPLGANAESLYLIRRGRIVLTLPIQIDGHDQDVAVEEHAPGETLGWSALVPPHKFTLKATAPLPSEVLAIPRQALLDYCAAHPAAGYAIGMNIAGIIGHRLQIFQAMWLRQMQRAVSRTHA